MRRVVAGLIPAAAVAAVAVIVACTSPYGDDAPSPPGGSSSGSSDASEGLESGTPEAASINRPTRQTLEAFSSTFCDRFAECASDGLVRHIYGTSTNCKARQLAQLELNLVGAGSTVTDSGIQACRTAYTTMSCADLFIGAQPKECDIRGTLVDGTTCASHAQCTSGLCFIPKGATCGKCTTRIAEGGECTNTFCELGLRCDTTKKCVKPGAVGAMCVENINCVPPLVCIQTQCTKPLGHGELCKVGMGEIPCNEYEYLFCAQTLDGTPDGTCADLSFAGTGGACGLTQSNPMVITLCENSGTCNETTKKCEPYVADGAGCDLINGPGCQTPAECRAGTCRLTDPSICK